MRKIHEALTLARDLAESDDEDAQHTAALEEVEAVRASMRDIADALNSPDGLSRTEAARLSAMLKRAVGVDA